MKTTVINIYGAPGSGKSTLAADLYTAMKKDGKSVELVREEIKIWAWTNHKPTVFEQIYITNKQMLMETSLYGKVEYLITDSPLELGDFYCRHYHKCNALSKLTEKIYIEAALLDLINYPISLYLPISPEIYSNEGRFSNVYEAQELDKKLRDNIGKFYPTTLTVLNDYKTRLEKALEVINDARRTD